MIFDWVWSRWVWPFISRNSKICRISRINLWIEMVFLHSNNDTILGPKTDNHSLQLWLLNTGGPVQLYFVILVSVDLMHHHISSRIPDSFFEKVFWNFYFLSVMHWKVHSKVSISSYEEQICSWEITTE